MLRYWIRQAKRVTHRLMTEEQTDGKYEPRGTRLHGEQRDLRGTSCEIFLFSFYQTTFQFCVFHSHQLNPVPRENLFDDNSSTGLLRLFQISYEIVLYEKQNYCLVRLRSSEIMQLEWEGKKEFSVLVIERSVVITPEKISTTAISKTGCISKILSRNGGSACSYVINFVV